MESLTGMRNGRARLRQVVVATTICLGSLHVVGCNKGVAPSGPDKARVKINLSVPAATLGTLVKLVAAEEEGVTADLLGMFDTRFHLMWRRANACVHEYEASGRSLGGMYNADMVHKIVKAVEKCECGLGRKDKANSEASRSLRVARVVRILRGIHASPSTCTVVRSSEHGSGVTVSTKWLGRRVDDCGAKAATIHELSLKCNGLSEPLDFAFVGGAGHWLVLEAAGDGWVAAIKKVAAEHDRNQLNAHMK